MAIRTLIVDDEPHAIEILKKYTAQMPYMETVATCRNAFEAFRELQNSTIDLMLADIKMPGLLGTDLVRSLKAPPMVIFTTAFEVHAIEGFDLNAIDYLVKPISFNRFLRAIDKVMHYTRGQQQSLRAEVTDMHRALPQKYYLYLRIDRQTIKVSTSEILWIESVKDYIKVVTTEKTYIAKQKISVTEKLLPLGQFMRVHRSFIIPIQRVEAFHPQYLLVAGHRIVIGRNYKEACVSKFSVQQQNW